MSRIGRKPIEIPKDVKVVVENRTITIQGPKGQLSWNYPDKIKVSVNGSTIVAERTDNSRTERSLHGLTRSIISNMVTGVSQGYQKVLEIVGVGYRAQVKGDKIVLTLGYSHPIEVQLPEGIKAS
ncbi:MAG: 50S ribosomal protein L6, partial [Nitrospirae bacterium]|nr:50S ribosomal protein L6 [Nitrospirota bacterium]